MVSKQGKKRPHGKPYDITTGKYTQEYKQTNKQKARKERADTIHYYYREDRQNDEKQRNKRTKMLLLYIIRLFSTTLDTLPRRCDELTYPCMRRTRCLISSDVCSSSSTLLEGRRHRCTRTTFNARGDEKGRCAENKTPWASSRRLVDTVVLLLLLLLFVPTIIVLYCTL